MRVDEVAKSQRLQREVGLFPGHPEAPRQLLALHAFFLQGGKQFGLKAERGHPRCSTTQPFGSARPPRSARIASRALGEAAPQSLRKAFTASSTGV